MPDTTSKSALLRRPEVLQRCGISNSTLHRLINAGDFPPPIQLSPRAVAWIEEEVSTWIDQRIEASRTQGGAA
ncbi:AlpA family transcriptional regulator [Halomonas litopenaei]|uniref:AlpA family transcriptional regulator n=1 Tax=Halomonas litopenaei TaxID=2109328 RepID=A0ABX5IY97_9GAMM|nr:MULTISPECIES: AlpA family transcriptional regulator [Halomonas]MBN8413008.1 AlpA family transcriptional regulator [Halomonas litopenaei]PTL90141.1 AlpA family transcriptional regulator [Halomonas sp. SYSU XM8]PTL95553.1 AlpA family transcriptional regulator [Halomonas litopenaei]